MNDDFHRLRESGRRAGTSKLIGLGFCTARDAIARGLLALGVTPNVVTAAGAVFTACGAVCLFLGGGYSHSELREMGRPPYMLMSAFFLLLGCAMDMLDGAVAKIGRLQTPLGAVLDSSMDRVSDAAVFVALVGHFAWRGNVTYCVLAAVCLTNAMLISYVKARSECVIPHCDVGYWIRGERFAGFLIGVFAATISGVLWIEAILPIFTVVRRLVWFRRVLEAQALGAPLPENKLPKGPVALLRPWRYPRGSIPYDIVTGLNILFIIQGHRLHPLFGPHADPLGDLVRRMGY
jgi:CDP-diacylglycerol--glycerol-3-phosphate 3-phosphatidyltransferase